MPSSCPDKVMWTAQPKTIHGNETRKARTERAEGMRRLRALEDLGYALGIMSGPRTLRRKPTLAGTPKEIITYSDK